MKIKDICENVLAEIVIRPYKRKGDDEDQDVENKGDITDKDKYYADGIPVSNVNVEDENGNVKSGMVYLCPLCNGSGENKLKRAGRLNASHITQQAEDLFGGGCNKNNRDYRCVNGLMQDKNTGKVFWPNDAPRVKKERPPKESDNINVSIESFKEEEPKLWAYMEKICDKYKKEPDKNSITKSAFAIHNDFINQRETTKSKIDLFRRKYEDFNKPKGIVYPSEKIRKTGENPNKDKAGYAINDKVKQTFRPMK